MGSSYKDVDGVITGDDFTYPQVMETAADRTKRYAIELMSLEYTFYGTVGFCAENTGAGNAANAAEHETALEETPKEAEVLGVSTSESWHSNPIDCWRREMLEEYAEDDWHWEGPISYEYEKAWKDELEFQMWEYGRLGAEEEAEAYLEAVEREAEALMDLWDWQHDERDGGEEGKLY